MLLLISFVDILFQLYMLMLFVRIISSWFPEFQNSRVMQFISFYTDPYLNFFRSFIPPLGMFDFSPIVAFFFLQFMNSVVLKFLTIIIFQFSR
jgi:YggT family protein